MINRFSYKSVNSISHEVYFKSLKSPLRASMKTRIVDLPQASGQYDFGDNEYDVITIEMNLVYMPTSLVNRKIKMREIADWLASDTWEKLILGDEPDKYYLARVSNEIDLERLTSSGEARVSFVCQPFAYMAEDINTDSTWEDASFTWLTSLTWGMSTNYSFSATGETSFTFNNPGTRAINYKSPQGSKFNIIIDGVFRNLTLTLNGKTLTHGDYLASGTFTIDNYNMEVNLNGDNDLSEMSGDLGTFLEILPGENTITVSGTSLDAEITLDFIPMWY